MLIKCAKKYQPEPNHYECGSYGRQIVYHANAIYNTFKSNEKYYKNTASYVDHMPRYYKFKKITINLDMKI